MAELKLLDPNRKAILMLPDPAFKLWMTYWMYESDAQEAYPSLDRLEQVSGQCRNTILKWRSYLQKHGWLIRLQGYAAERYSKPTRGSHKVIIFRVDEPKGSPDEPIDGGKGSSCRPHEMHTRFTSVSASTSLPVSVPEAPPACTATPLRGGRREASPSGINSTAKAKTKTPASAVKHNPKYDAPFPYDFKTWSQPDRTRWSIEHLVPIQGEKDSAPVEKQATARPRRPPNTPPPPGVAGTAKKFQCPACAYSRNRGYEIAEHIEAVHPELGQQTFRLECPQDGCPWRTHWNRISDNKAKADAEVIDHLEVEHNPDSPRYNPWEHCPTCKLCCQRSELPTHNCTTRS